MLVVNTCAFIDKAKQESIDTILELAEHKKTGRCTRLVVTGCLAERYRDELTAQIPEIDVVLGTGELPRHRRRHGCGRGRAGAGGHDHAADALPPRRRRRRSRARVDPCLGAPS